MVALSIAKAKKSHTIAEMLVKPCLLDCAKTVLDDRAYKSKQDSFSNDVVKSRIIKMSNDIKIQLTSATTFAALPFAIRLDEPMMLSTCHNYLSIFAMYVAQV